MSNTIGMADGTQVKTLEELREHFDLVSVLEHYTSGKLLEWLEKLHCEEEAAAVAAMNPFMPEFEKSLCTLFQVPFSLDEMMLIYEKAVRENNAEAQFRLGCCYLFRYGIIISRGVKGKTRNHKKMLKGAELTRRAAEQGHPFAQYSFGNFCRYVQRSDEASIWYQKAADQGYIEAQYSLGTLESCLKAAERGHIRAKVRIGKLFFYGKGVEQNDQEAAKWYREAAEQGDMEAAYRLCLCYLTGRGVEKNEEEAERWCRFAGSEDSVCGAFRVGEWYFYGHYVEQDFHEAGKWYHKAFLEQEDWLVINKLDLCLAILTGSELEYKFEEFPKRMRGVLGHQYFETYRHNRDYNANVAMLMGNDQSWPHTMCEIPEGNEENDIECLWRRRLCR